MKFEVPQFIEVEDKIFGPLTWRQFLYLGGGIGMAATMFFMLPFIFFVIFGIPLALLAAALAFYPVNNRPFSYFLESFLSYLSGPKLYLWRKENALVYKNTTPITDQTSITQPVKRSGADISSLARELELKAIQKPQ